MVRAISMCQVRWAMERGVPIPARIAQASATMSQLSQILERALENFKRAAPRGLRICLRLLGEPVDNLATHDEQLEALANFQNVLSPDLLVEKHISASLARNGDGGITGSTPLRAELINVILAVASWKAQARHPFDFTFFSDKFEENAFHWQVRHPRESHRHVWVAWSMQRTTGKMCGHYRYLLQRVCLHHATERKSIAVPPELQTLAQEVAGELLLPNEIRNRLDPASPATDVHLLWLLSKNRPRQATADHNRAEVSEDSEDDQQL